MTIDPAKLAQKQKKQWIITSVLLVIFAISFTKNVLLYKKKPPAPTPEAQSQDTGQSMAEDLLFVTNLRLKDKQFADQLDVWKKEWGRDPFVPQGTVVSVVRAVNLTLKGILWDDVAPKAIVNEKTLFEGDTIYGYTVEKIHPRSVLLRTGEKVIELHVFRPFTADN